MPTDVAAPVESSTPATVPNFEPSTYTEAQRDAWINSGSVPTMEAVAEASEEAPEETEAVAESAPAEGETEEVVNAAEATTPKKGTQQPETPKGKGADARKEQLNAEIRDLAAKRKTAETEYNEILAKLEKGKKDVPAESSTAAPVKEKTPEKPVAPVWGEKDGETFEQYEVRQQEHVQALVKYTLAEERQAEVKKRQEETVAAENKRIEESWNARVATAKAKPGRDNFAEVAFSKELPITPAMDGFILDSEIGPELLWYLGSHLDEGKAIAAMNPYRAVRTLTLLETKLSVAEEAPVEETPDEPVAAAPEKKPVVVPPTKAKKPPTNLGAVASAPPDDVKAAVESGNVQRFMDLRNAQDIAKHKRG